MIKDIQLNPGDIVTVTEVAGYQPVAIGHSFNDTVPLSAQTEYDVIRELKDFVEIREVDRNFATEKIVHKVFLQLKVRVENRPKFRLTEDETSFQINEIALNSSRKYVVSYNTIAVINKSTPIELLEEAIRLIKQENGKETHE